MEKRVGVISFPGSVNIPVLNLISLLDPLVARLYVMTDDSVGVFVDNINHIQRYSISHQVGSYIPTRILRHAKLQLIIARNMIVLWKKVDMWLFLVGGEGLLFPMIVAKLLNRRVLLILAGFPERGSKVNRDPYSLLVKLLSKCCCALADKIIVYSKSIVQERRLQKYADKVTVAHRHFVDPHVFSVDVPFWERKGTSIGFVGRFTEVKGIKNFIASIPTALQLRGDLHFLIIGDGQEKAFVDAFLADNRLNKHVTKKQWVPHKELPRYLNELKLLVIPSLTEGLPNIMLEAMFCGTPVLATPVGAVPDIICEGETGFILQNNAPELIATRIVEALANPDIERVAETARTRSMVQFSYEKTQALWKNIIQDA